MELPTVKQVVEKVGVRGYVSIRYRDTRVINKYLDSPVLAYGVGFGAAIVVFKTKRKFLRAYYMGVQSLFSRWQMAQFSLIDVETAVNELSQKHKFYESYLNVEEMKDAREKYEPLVVGEMRIQLTDVDRKDGYVEQTIHRLCRFKSGKLFAVRKDNWNDSFTRERMDYFFEAYIKYTAMKIGYVDRKAFWKNKLVGFENNIPAEIIQEAKNQRLVKEI